jgi:hypothetical protein
MKTLSAFAAVTMLAAFPALAADDRDVGTTPETWNGTWGLDAEASSAALARDGWKFLAMSTLSWPDGRQAVVTMWMNKLGDFARCFDYFDAKMVQAGGKCERSGTGL